jgi:hypothetical protein
MFNVFFGVMSARSKEGMPHVSRIKPKIINSNITANEKQTDGDDDGSWKAFRQTLRGLTISNILHTTKNTF